MAAIFKMAAIENLKIHNKYNKIARALKLST